MGDRRAGAWSGRPAAADGDLRRGSSFSAGLSRRTKRSACCVVTVLIPHGCAWTTHEHLHVRDFRGWHAPPDGTMLAPIVSRSGTQPSNAHLTRGWVRCSIPFPSPVAAVMQTIINEQSPQERADHEAGHYVAAYTLQIRHRIAFITIENSPPTEDGEVQGGCCALEFTGETQVWGR